MPNASVYLENGRLSFPVATLGHEAPSEDGAVQRLDAIRVPLNYLPNGEWTVRVKLPGENGKELDSRYVKIEEFAPPQIRVKVDVEGNCDLKAFSFGVSAEHLFGGAARGLPCEGAVVFEDVPFAPKGWEGFKFGNDDLGLKPCFRRLGRTTLDEFGNVTFRFHPLEFFLFGFLVRFFFNLFGDDDL